MGIGNEIRNEKQVQHVALLSALSFIVKATKCFSSLEIKFHWKENPNKPSSPQLKCVSAAILLQLALRKESCLIIAKITKL